MLIENKILSDFSILVNEDKQNKFKGTLKTGVDLGTANIVLTVVDEDNN